MALVSKRRFSDVLYLLFRGELPSAEESQLLDTLMVAMISPGPATPATQAAMLAGVGKTDPLHILPIGLGVLGRVAGAGEIEASMRFLSRSRRKEPYTLAEQLLAEYQPEHEGDHQIAPGFGSHYGDIDPIATKLSEHLIDLPGCGETLHWAVQFSKALQPANEGVLHTGIAAAIFVDFGIKPRAGGGLFQLLQAPGLLAHGLEQSNKPLTAMPFLEDEHYVFEE
ncbi:citrate/2-methylcitrate synthase [Candidatus Reidiella endopervernicosa]|uniref:Citrate synthase n=1 Tax=Candidatus Reidiella endopervernicosa TaxID=2738883 RepID=A0A6N0I0A8_9GAMM|nr:citrate/2-methylcitrate synthase [Candidatus Reidiella endopervernicosa]QKQ28054.1 citrate synthase [Candidatus Reidiella endopervernicosa]